MTAAVDVEKPAGKDYLGQSGSSCYVAKRKVVPHFVGGNEISKALPSKVKEFVVSSEGHSVISSVRMS